MYFTQKNAWKQLRKNEINLQNCPALLLRVQVKRAWHLNFANVSSWWHHLILTLCKIKYNFSYISRNVQFIGSEKALCINWVSKRHQNAVGICISHFWMPWCTHLKILFWTARNIHTVAIVWQVKMSINAPIYPNAPHTRSEQTSGR